MSYELCIRCTVSSPCLNSKFKTQNLRSTTTLDNTIKNESDKGMTTNMNKRIYLSFLCLITIFALLFAGSISVIVYNRMINQEKAAIRDKAILISDLLNEGINVSDVFFTDFNNRSHGVARLTIISPDGTVLLDNKADTSQMGNHANRIEFQKALIDGFHEVNRYSETLGATAYYFAIHLNDGNVLRVSQTNRNISEVTYTILFILIVISLVILVLVHIVARSLTRRILNPLNEINLESDENGSSLIHMYEELIPFVLKIDQQKRKIANQISMLKYRADTIETITGNINEGLILLDKDGIVLISNKSASEILEDDGMVNNQITHICRDIEFGQAVKMSLSGTSSMMVLERYNKSYNVYFSPVFTDNELGGAVILLQGG